MRATSIAVLVLFACSSNHSGTVPDGAGCPAQHDPGSAACSLNDGTSCFFFNDFSPCVSETCTCDHGTWACHGIDASDGASCANSPLSTCNFEGVPYCGMSQTSEYCSCDADGTWHCVCSCYGQGSTCGGCPSRFLPEADGARCNPVNNVCSYPNGHECRCEDTNGLGPHLHCI